MASSVAPPAFGVRAPARTSRGAFRLPARASRAVAVGRVAPMRPRGGTTLGSLSSPSATAATDPGAEAAGVACASAVVRVHGVDEFGNTVLPSPDVGFGISLRGRDSRKPVEMLL